MNNNNNTHTPCPYQTGSSAGTDTKKITTKTDLLSLKREILNDILLDVCHVFRVTVVVQSKTNEINPCKHQREGNECVPVFDYFF